MLCQKGKFGAQILIFLCSIYLSNMIVNFSKTKGNNGYVLRIPLLDAEVLVGICCDNGSRIIVNLSWLKPFWLFKLISGF